jgi:hypothetical protein
MSGDEIHLSGQNWMFNAGPALSLNRESSVGAFDRSARMFHHSSATDHIVFIDCALGAG